MSQETRKLRNKVCPYVKSPLPECICTKISSDTVEEALKYCLGTFKKCPLYQTALDREAQVLQGAAFI